MTVHDTALGPFDLEIGHPSSASLERDGFSRQDGTVSVHLQGRSVALHVWRDDAGDLALASEVVAGVWVIGRRPATPPQPSAS